MYFYSIFSERRSNEDVGEYTSYGIAVYFASYGIYREKARISDITQNKRELSELCALCTRSQLSPLHIFDVIEDFVFSALS